MSKKHRSARNSEHDDTVESPDQPDTAPEEALTDGSVEAEEVRVDAEEAPAGREDKSADEEKHSPRKLTRGELLSMVASKNEMGAKLTREKRQLEHQVGELNDKWMRSVAEFENYRRRTRKEWDLLKQQTRAEVIVEILSIVDDFERAFSAMEEDESSGFVEGFRLIYNNLIQTLNRMGVTELAAIGKSFDPNFHMAVGQVDRDDLDSGMVAEVVQKGYLLDDAVIRPANVLVAK